MKFDIIQSFYLDPTAVNNSLEIFLTSVDLYFESKPSRTNNLSGITSPGVVIRICEVENNIPNLSKIIPGSLVRIDYDRIFAIGDASTSTNFPFNSPIQVKTGRFYGVVVSFDDPDYSLWLNKQGDNIIGTNTPSPGSHNSVDGIYYEGNGEDIKGINDTDIKYKINIAKFTANTARIELVNKHYEFLSVNVVSGTFIGGEKVYANTTNQTGTVAVTAGNTILIGTGTSFDISQQDRDIVVVSGANVNILNIDYVVNSTYLSCKTAPNISNTSATFKFTTTGEVFYKNELNNKLFLVDSSANATVNLANGNYLIGESSKAVATINSVDDYVVDSFTPSINVNSTSIGSVDGNYVMSYSNGSAYLISSDVNPLKFGELDRIRNYAATIRSRSLEVVSPNLYSSERNSAKSVINFTVNKPVEGLYSSPFISSSDLNFFCAPNKISANYISGGIDTEIYKNGIAQCKYISSKISFANNRFAEDVSVYMTSYKPSGTDIRVYVRLYNSADPESFDDKVWTPLDIVDNANKYSSSSNTSDIIEYSYRLPKYPESNNTISGNFTTAISNNVVLTNGVDQSADITANDLIKIYDPLFPDNRMVAHVSSVNTTAVVLSSKVSNNNIVGVGMKIDKLKYKNVAFNNSLNDNICRYYNTNLSEFDKFDVMQLKVVILAANSNMTPYVNQIEFIGVSA